MQQCVPVERGAWANGLNALRRGRCGVGMGAKTRGVGMGHFRSDFHCKNGRRWTCRTKQDIDRMRSNKDAAKHEPFGDVTSKRRLVQGVSARLWIRSHPFTSSIAAV
eukprot:2246674-Pleurochrysis_carterae.AAC.2